MVGRDSNSVRLQIKRARCALNKKILDILNEESISVIEVVQQLAYKFNENLPQLLVDC